MVSHPSTHPRLPPPAPPVSTTAASCCSGPLFQQQQTLATPCLCSRHTTLAQTYVLKLARSGEDGEKVYLLLESGARFHTTQVGGLAVCRRCGLGAGTLAAGERGALPHYKGMWVSACVEGVGRVRGGCAA